MDVGEGRDIVLTRRGLTVMPSEGRVRSEIAVEIGETVRAANMKEREGSGRTVIRKLDDFIEVTR